MWLKFVKSLTALQEFASSGDSPNRNYRGLGRSGERRMPGRWWRDGFVRRGKRLGKVRDGGSKWAKSLDGWSNASEAGI